MLVSGTRLLHSAIRLSDVAFPASDTLIARTRLIYLHLDNLLSFAKRDRDGKVDAYFLGYLPDELILLFFQRGELGLEGTHAGTDRRVALVDKRLDLKAQLVLETGEVFVTVPTRSGLRWSPTC